MSFAQFQDAVDRVLPVIKEATAKERAMMGVGRSTGVAPTTTPITSGFKRKRGASRNDDIAQTGHEMEYFFAKFLTSPELLELEVNTHCAVPTRINLFPDSRHPLPSPNSLPAPHPPHASP